MYFCCIQNSIIYSYKTIFISYTILIVLFLPAWLLKGKWYSATTVLFLAVSPCISKCFFLSISSFQFFLSWILLWFSFCFGVCLFLVGLSCASCIVSTQAKKKKKWTSRKMNKCYEKKMGEKLGNAWWVWSHFMTS